MSDNVISASANINVHELVSKSKGVVLLDFWSPTCAPCRALMPTLNKVGEEYKDDEFKIIKVNIMEHHDVVANYNITVLPTLLLFGDGKREEEMRGVPSYDEIIKKIEDVWDRLDGSDEYDNTSCIGVNHFAGVKYSK